MDGLLCSFFLKTALFLVAEEVDIETFQLSKLFFCYSNCLDKFIVWVKKCYCPKYSIPEHNMFLGQIDLDNNKILINLLDSIKCDGIEGLTTQLFPHDNGNYRLLKTYSESSFVMLDLPFYRIFGCHDVTDISRN